MERKELLKRFGKRIRDIRMERGLSQEQLGKLMGFSAPRSSISQIECGINDLPLSKVSILAECLGVDVRVFFMDSEIETAYIKADPITQRNVRRLLDVPEKGEDGTISTSMEKRQA